MGQEDIGGVELVCSVQVGVGCGDCDSIGYHVGDHGGAIKSESSFWFMKGIPTY